MTRWLTAREMRGWRAFAEVSTHLLAALEADLSAHNLTRADYEVLVILSESRDHRLRMCDLALRLGLSPSGLTRRLDGLVKLGYVKRMPSTSDRRVMLATVTDVGLEAMKAAAADHVSSVRRHLVYRLTPEQIDTLGDTFCEVGRGLGRDVAVA